MWEQHCREITHTGIEVTQTDVEIAHRHTHAHASPAFIEEPSSVHLWGVTSNSQLILAKARQRFPSGLPSLRLRQEQVWHPTPTCHLLTQLSAISVRPLPGELVLRPPGLPSVGPGLLPPGSQAQSCPARGPVPVWCSRGHCPSPGHLRQEAGRGQGRHSNWGGWFYREEVDSSTSNTGDAGPTLPPAPLSYPCLRPPAPPPPP